jgi:hypothetical protein
VLQTPVDAAPSHDDAFVIVDQRLVVQAISRRAEAVLEITEPEGVGVPIRHLLQSETGDPGDNGLTDLVEVAACGGVPSGWLQLRSVRDAQVRFLARVTSCGPPPAALFVLTPFPERLAPPEPQPGRGAAGEGDVAGLALGSRAA